MGTRAKQLAGQPRGRLPRFFQVWEDEAASLSMFSSQGSLKHILGARNTSQAKRGARPRKVPMKTLLAITTTFRVSEV